MKNIDWTYVAIGASWLLLGMMLGIVMGATNNFQFVPVHAHINLVGFACHAIFGVAYRHWPTMKVSSLAPYQFWVFIVATPITLIGLQGNESRLTRLWLQRAESVQQVLRVPGGALAAALDRPFVRDLADQIEGEVAYYRHVFGTVTSAQA